MYFSLIVTLYFCLLTCGAIRVGFIGVYCDVSWLFALI